MPGFANVLGLDTITGVNRDRYYTARAIDRLLSHVDDRPLSFGLYPLVRPAVLSAVSGPLASISATLHDERVPVDPAAVSAVRVFLTHGADSPLYRQDVAAAAAAANALERSLRAAA